ncbi:MAG TPA: ABC transporter permease [Tepidiformaceae bacterium]|nr:ABC transporter permease [Tepidiformaceae bacterium]
MGTYIVRRLLLMIPTIVLVGVCTFSLLRLVPGDTITAQILSTGQPGVQYDHAKVAQMKKQLGLSGSIPSQFWNWVSDMARGDFQKSFVTNKDSLSEFGSRLGPTVELGILAVLFSALIGLPIGILSAVYQDSPIDLIGRLIAILALAIPNFAIALLVVVFGAREFKYAFPTGSHPFFSDPSGNVQQFFIPAAVIALGSAGVLMRLTRTSMLDVLRQDFIRTAKAKGIRPMMVIHRHALKNALMPVVTIIGAQLSAVIAGAVIIESIFNIRGVGLQTLTAVNQRDYPQVQTNVLIFALILLVGNLLTDLAYGLLDPRIRY